MSNNYNIQDLIQKFNKSANSSDNGNNDKDLIQLKKFDASDLNETTLESTKCETEIQTDTKNDDYLSNAETLVKIRNFICEEETYSNVLQDVVEKYISQIDTDKYEDIFEVFGRIDIINSFESSTFLPELKRSKGISEIADCFIKNIKMFNTYYDFFFRNKPNMILVLNENKHIFKQKLSESEYKEYEQFLLKGLNMRILQYGNFLEMVKNAVSENNDAIKFNRALEIVTELMEAEDENLRFVISELVETERVYLEKLEKIVDDVFPKIRQILKGGKRQKAVVGAVPEIYMKQIEFYNDLRRCLFEFNPNEVAECFLKHKSNFYLYVQDHKMKNNPNAIDECRKIMERLEERNFDIFAPLNRLYKYKLLIQEIKKNCVKIKVPSQLVDEATNMIIHIIKQINSVAAMNSIRDENIVLHDLGELILRDQFTVWYKSNYYDAMVFLFEKSVVFTEIKTEGPQKNRRDVFIYRNHIIAKYLSLNENVDSLTEFRLEFYGTIRKYSHTLRAKGKATKHTWIKTINSLLMQQLQEEKLNNQ